MFYIFPNVGNVCIFILDGCPSA